MELYPFVLEAHPQLQSDLAARRVIRAIDFPLGYLPIGLGFPSKHNAWLSQRFVCKAGLANPASMEIDSIDEWSHGGKAVRMGTLNSRRLFVVGGEPSRVAKAARKSVVWWGEGGIAFLGSALDAAHQGHAHVSLRLSCARPTAASLDGWHSNEAGPTKKTNSFMG